MNEKEMNSVCKIINNDTKRPRKVKIIPNVLSSTECDKIIQEAEIFADDNNWIKKRHEEYPTTDNEITNDWLSYNKILSKIYTKIIPTISKELKIKRDYIGINEIFVAKYDMKGQKSLQKHEDGSEFSFVISLNDEYEGGGTFFTKLKKKIILPKGSAVVFSGKETHKGIKITSGTRYIVTGFLNIFNEDYCDDL